MTTYRTPQACARCDTFHQRSGLLPVGDGSWRVCLSCDRLLRREHADVVAWIAAASGLAA